jgi:TPP-dependent pyruvate/acetoin dehydrogenase alpha subunit
MNSINKLELYRKLALARHAEETIAKIYPTDKIKSPVHLSIGQEAISVGVCNALVDEDIVFGYYRSHAMYIAKGGDINAMFAELYGKETGCAKGKGGSMHLVDTKKGIMGTSAIVASTIPNSVGYAYGLKLQKKNNVVVSFFGDGATEEGVFSESLNFAALKKVPVIFICENNGLAIHTQQDKRQALPDISLKAKSFGLKVITLEQMDIIEIAKVVSEVVDNIKNKECEPYFIEIKTSRWLEHVGPNCDFDMGYRQESEVAPWKETDQLTILGELITTEEKTLIELEVKKIVDDAINYAENSAFPQASELHNHVFK